LGVTARNMIWRWICCWFEWCLETKYCDLEDTSTVMWNPL